jgi:hypothetical protein
MDCTENTASKISSVVACVSSALGVYLLSRCLAIAACSCSAILAFTHHVTIWAHTVLIATHMHKNFLAREQFSVCVSDELLAQLTF